MKEIVVIVLNWNGYSKGLLEEYLPPLIDNTPSELADILVADNGSDDVSIDFVRQRFPQVKCDALMTNYGFAGGYNHAVRRLCAGGERPKYCLFLNDDVRVTKGWLEPLYHYMETHPRCAAVQPKIVKDRAAKATGPDTFEYAGACGGYLDKNYYPFCRGRIFGTVESDNGQYDLPKGEAYPVMWTSGACMLIRTEWFQASEGFDYYFFAHQEEIDLCWRLRRQGYELACLPEVKVYHRGGASLRAKSPKKTLLNFRNSLIMTWKNLPYLEFRTLKTRRYYLDIIAALRFLLHGHVRNAYAIFKARKQAFEIIRDKYSLEDNEKLYALGTAPHFKEQDVNIIWEYYIGGIKKFSKLKF